MVEREETGRPLSSIGFAIAQAAERATAAERERCAKVADEQATVIAARYEDYPLGEQLSAIAEAIRRSHSLPQKE